MNNFKKIKAMSIEEMAEFIKCEDCYYCHAAYCRIWRDNEEYTAESCQKYAKQWLEQESEEE